MSNSSSEQYRIEEFVIEEEPFYVAASDEVEIFEAAYRQHVPVLLKGPTGRGKTRFVEYMAGVSVCRSRWSRTALRACEWNLGRCCAAGHRRVP